MVLFLETKDRCLVLVDEPEAEVSNLESSSTWDVPWVQRLKKLASSFENVPEDHIYLCENGRILGQKKLFNRDERGDRFIAVHFRLPGGKGGFGSMLRALGAQIEKTTNREACRDLSGRRMRDVNNEKKIGDWLKKQKEEEENRAKRKQERLERLVNPPKHRLNDPTYITQMQENADKVDSALRQGLKLSTKQDSTIPELVGAKRKIESENGRAKRARLWLGVGDLSDEDEEGGANRETNEVEDTDKIVSPVPNEQVTTKDFHQQEKIVEVKQDRKIQTEIEPVEKKTEVDAKTNKHLDDNHSNGEIKTNETKLSPGGDQKKQLEVEPLDLGPYNSAEELEAVGLDRLKSALMALGLKCGGTLQQRAQRLYLTKDTPLDKLDKSLFAKSAKKKA